MARLEVRELGVTTEGPCYEKAIMCRGLENTIYFASVNYTCGEEGVLVQDLDLAAATGLPASRYAPERYQGGDAG